MKPPDSSATVSPRVLVVEDDTDARSLLLDELASQHIVARGCEDAARALDALQAETWDVLVTDVNMQGMSGIELCQLVASRWPDLPVIVVTAFGSLETAVAALRAGAYDFITKPFELDAVTAALRRAADHFSLKREVRRLRQVVRETRRLGQLVGASPAMQKVYDLVDRVADSDASVLITGESGTGKELVARELHARSRRRDRPFVAVSCAALPEALLESELFGHVRGAFTDAKASRVGLFVQANGGTLFLDEIGEMPVGLQPKLLRALQERRVRAVGSDTEAPFDARLVAATNRDLEAAIESQIFREDLFYRINVVNLALPPLRARGGDTLLLAEHFLERFATLYDKPVSALSAAAARKLSAYPFPGNVRELANCMERAVALARSEVIQEDDLPERVTGYRGSHVLVTSDDPSELVPLEEVERRYVLRVLSATQGNKSLAAQILGLSRKTLYRRLEGWGVDDSEEKG